MFPLNWQPQILRPFWSPSSSELQHYSCWDGDTFHPWERTFLRIFCCSKKFICQNFPPRGFWTGSETLDLTFFKLADCCYFEDTASVKVILIDGEYQYLLFSQFSWHDIVLVARKQGYIPETGSKFFLLHHQTWLTQAWVSCYFLWNLFDCNGFRRQFQFY